MRKRLALEIRDEIDLGLQAHDGTDLDLNEGIAHNQACTLHPDAPAKPSVAVSSKIFRVQKSFFNGNGKNTKGIGTSFVALKDVLDVFKAAGGSLRATALALRVSSSQTSKLLCRDNDVLIAANKIRLAHGLKPIRPRRR